MPSCYRPSYQIMKTKDVAVIEIEKDGKESAVLQIVGDEDIFGENVICRTHRWRQQYMKGKGRGPSPTEDDTYGFRQMWWLAITVICSSIQA